MAANVLNSPQAVRMNVFVVRAFAAALAKEKKAELVTGDRNSRRWGGRSKSTGYHDTGEEEYFPAQLQENLLPPVQRLR